jgi:hypothetical protein
MIDIMKIRLYLLQQFYRENVGSEGGVSGAHQGWEVVNGSLSNRKKSYEKRRIAA